MTFTDATNRRAVVIFDPRKPWKDQTPEILPAPAGAGSFLTGAGLSWSPDGTKLAGTVNNTVTIYDTVSKQYRPVANVRGAVYTWLKDGRLLVGPPEAPRLVDPATGVAKAIAVPKFGDQIPTEYRVSADERSVYFSLERQESDIWLVDLGRKPRR
jgi:hypothetical protein